ncbi:MAG: LptF/LptG family permease [Bacteroidales bacterium]
MLKIKRLYRFILETFLPIFLMTFLISIFILLMQFLWRYVDELVGKGLSMSVLGEFFFYSALSLIPMALPLSILLASLMTFGNLGERLELLAMKAAGVPLIRIMRPLIVFIASITLFSFIYQNELNPKVQVKTYSLLMAMKQKSPELDIPESTFYDQIDGYNMYVASKNLKTGMLYDVMVYDYSKGFENATVIVADSAKLVMTEDKKALFFNLWSGESFENLQKQRTASNSVPYRRETFSYKEILIEFDTNFNRMDESFLSGQYIGKNLQELRSTADSLRVITDSLERVNGRTLLYGTPINTAADRINIADSLKVKSKVATATKSAISPIYSDSLFHSKTAKQRREVMAAALSAATSRKQDIEYRGYSYTDTMRSIRRHNLEWHRKFSLSVACLVFFFIGAPLGAIIRKGGLGMPAVISVMLFIFYYIIDNTGYKFARDGVMPAWQGMWLSTFVLIPLGVFLTYKAVKDSVLMNSEAYSMLFKKLFGKRTQRELSRKEVVIYSADMGLVKDLLSKLDGNVKSFLKDNKSSIGFNYFTLWRDGDQFDSIEEISQQVESVVEELLNADSNSFFHKISEYPIIQIERLNMIPRSRALRWTLGILFPIGIPLFIISMVQRRVLKSDLQNIERINYEISNLISK